MDFVSDEVLRGAHDSRPSDLKYIGGVKRWCGKRGPVAPRAPGDILKATIVRGGKKQILFGNDKQKAKFVMHIRDAHS